MRSVHLKGAPLALLAWLAATAAHAGVDIRTVSDQNGRVVIQLDNSTPLVFAPLTAFFVAISHSGTYAVKFGVGPAPSASQSWSAAALDTVTVSAPFELRGARIVRVEVRIPANTPTSHVVVDYTPAAVFNNAANADPLVKQLVVNRDVFPVQKFTGSPDPWFSLAAGWARLAVSERGVYAVTGADLSNAGVNLSAIDPATVRLYTQGGLDQARDFADPAGSWRAGGAMREAAVRVEAGNDGTFDPGDRVVFYGIGTMDWADYYDVSAPDSVYHEHTHAKTNYYFLGWGGSLPGAPLRMSDVDATPIAAADVTTCLHREYRERDLISDFDFRGDGWVWHDIAAPSANLYDLGTIDVTRLVASVPQQFLSVGLAPYEFGNTNHHAVFLDRRAAVTITVGDKVWDTLGGQRYYEDGVPIRIAGDFLLDGANHFFLKVPGDLNPNDKMLFAWYALWYRRRIVATGDAVGFSSPDTTGAANLRAGGFGTTGAISAFDVTDPWNPARLTGADVSTTGAARTVRISGAFSGRRRHFWIAAPPGLKKPGVLRLTTGDLRADAVGPHMLIVCHRDLRPAADRLRAYRASHLPLYSGAAVKVVTTDEVFDNFSGGMPDPMAIRNYARFLYDNYPDANGNPRLAYLLLLGDATEDFLNHVSVMPDFVPSNLHLQPTYQYTFSTDDWFGHLDAQDQVPGHGILDVAVGRLPAASADEAQFLVDRVIGYEQDAPRESWRDKVILVADDEKSSNKFACETEWTQQSELVTRFHAPDFLAFDKIYLVEYPNIVNVKPQSRTAFLSSWNAGALLINYIGHGSSVQLADEQVFLGSDVSQLVNGLKLPLFMAFSCTVGDFANPAGKSLSEKLLLRAEGGAIGAITASRESYPDPNSRVAFSIFEELFPTRIDGSRIPVGVALMHSKLVSLADTEFQDFQEENNWKYNLLADPALSLAFPQREIRFATASAETLIAGARHTLRGAVYDGGAVDTGFDGTVSVIVREPAARRRYTANCTGNITVDYLIPGGPIYQGTVDAVAGRFEVSFRVPRYAATGDLAYAGAYAHEGSRDATASVDSVLVVVPPTLEDSVALRAVDGAPRVSLGFKSGLQLVKPGDTVRAAVNDGDGINILNTTNEGRQAILIDDLPVPIDVNEFFAFDHGGVDTSGVLLYPLPDLNMGRHRLIYKVSDSFGFTTLDTLRFDVTDAADYYARAVFNYPNPFRDTTRFVFRISNRASIRLDVFTVSGRRVRRIEQVRDGGEVWVEWDGRDGAGEDVANGTYLYVASIDFVGLERPPVVLRGTLSRIR